MIKITADLKIDLHRITNKINNNQQTTQEYTGCHRDSEIPNEVNKLVTSNKIYRERLKGTDWFTKGMVLQENHRKTLIKARQNHVRSRTHTHIV